MPILYYSSRQGVSPYSAPRLRLLIFLFLAAAFGRLPAQVLAQTPSDLEQVIPGDVELQPLAAQTARVAKSMQYLGAPFPQSDLDAIKEAASSADKPAAIKKIQSILDKYVLLNVDISPESRVSVTPGATAPELVQGGWRSFLVKVINRGGVIAPLVPDSAQAQNAGGKWARGPNQLPYEDQKLTEADVADRWIALAPFNGAPMMPQLSGLGIEYRILQIYSRDSGKREATIGFNVGQGTQDIGFRDQTVVLFSCLPSTRVTFKVLDYDGRSSIAAMTILDFRRWAYPAKGKRTVPDFWFQNQIYRKDGEWIDLPAGHFDIEYTRGPEYIVQRKAIDVVAGQPQTVELKLQRWIDMPLQGWYSGDHHIHGAGCAHYDSPAQGVLPEDMFRHVTGEGLNFGDVLIWGPCYDFQKQFFDGKDNPVSNSETVLRYDVETSEFPSSENGHLDLLRLRDMNFPGAERIRNWPSWNLPILRWAKAQGAITGYAHSGLGLDTANDPLPTYVVPKFNGIGANEFLVDIAHGAVDILSAGDTPFTNEMNLFYHTLNAGFRPSIAGETDFPCIDGSRVGIGRSYAKIDAGKLNYSDWIEAVSKGKSYVSNGTAHLYDLRVNDGGIGGEVRLDSPQTIRVTLHAAALLDEKTNHRISSLPYNQRPFWSLERARIGDSREVPVEIILNGKVAVMQKLLADGKRRDLQFEIPIERSSWIAARIRPAAHTNATFILVQDQPVRPSRKSVDWCLKAIDQVWSNRKNSIRKPEVEAARKAYDEAREIFKVRMQESFDDSGEPIQ